MSYMQDQSILINVGPLLTASHSSSVVQSTQRVFFFQFDKFLLTGFEDLRTHN